MIEEIIEDYSQYTDNTQISFKDFLNEIISIDDSIKENGYKKEINQDELNDSLVNTLSKGIEIIQKEGVTDEQLKDLDIETFYKEVLGINDINNEKGILFPVYKGDSENTKNDVIYSNRINILNYLVKKGIIRISKFNIVALLDSEGAEGYEFANELFSDMKNNINNKYGERVGKRMIEGLKGKEKYLQLIIFERKNITQLLHRVIESEIKEFKFENNALFYGGKPIYPQIKYSDRSLFIELFFSKPKGIYFSLKEIYQYLEGGEDNYLNEKQSKKIYNLKDKINSKIFIETGIKKLFSLGKGYDIGNIYRKY